MYQSLSLFREGQNSRDLGPFVLPVPAPLLLLDGSLQRCRQPSKQHKVPVGHVLLSAHMFLSPMKQRRFVGGLGQVSATKRGSGFS